jgi:hypothetical protein
MEEDRHSDAVSEENNWGQMLSIDDSFVDPESDKAPHMVSTRDYSPGEWGCSSYLSKSKSGYFDEASTEEPNFAFDDSGY